MGDIPMKNLLVVSALLVLSTGCATSRSVKDGRLRDTWNRISDSDSLRTRGIGAANVKLASKTQRRATSRNAALVQARYEMLALIKGVNMGGGLTVAHAIQQDGDLKERVDRLIRGAEEVKAEWLEDDGCVVTIEIKRSKLKKILKEDRKWEEIQYRRAVRERQVPVYTSRVKEVSYGREKSLHKALFSGLLLPGGSIMYSGHPKAGGLALATILSMAAMGGDSPGMLYAAGAAHVLTAWWGIKLTADHNTQITVYPSRRGAGMMFSKKF